jgi:hypothetical protein
MPYSWAWCWDKRHDGNIALHERSWITVDITGAEAVGGPVILCEEVDFGLCPKNVQFPHTLLQNCHDSVHQMGGREVKGDSMVRGIKKVEKNKTN